MRTYEIIDVVVKHPKLGNLQKKNIIYRENEEDKGTPEFYKEGETEIRTGYTEKK